IERASSRRDTPIGFGTAIARRSTNCFSGIQGPAGNEQRTSRTFAKNHRSWLAKLLPNQQRSHDVPAERSVSGGNARAFKWGPGTRPGVRWLSYNVPASQHQSLGVGLQAHVFFAESWSGTLSRLRS